MPCRKCKKDLPDGAVFCCWCGVKQEVKRTGRTRPNGAGTAYKEGRTWRAVFVSGYSPNAAGKLTPDQITLGGFPTKSAALDFVPVLKAARVIPSSERNAVLREARTQSITEALLFVEQARRKSPTDSITFSALYDRWYPFYEPRVGKSTMAGHRSGYAYFKELHNLPFAHLTADDLQDCIDACPRGRDTMENMKSLAKRLYEYAIGRNIVSTNFALYIYINKEGGQRREALPAYAVDMIHSLIGKIPYVEYVFCLCYLGFRPNEMLTLTKDALRTSNGVEYLVGGFKTEAGTDRAVTISPKIAPIIHRLAQSSSPYFFPGPDGEPMTDEFLREKVFYPLMERIGLQSIPQPGERARYVPYSCRHFFANLLKDASGSDKDKAALIGHSDYETTVRVYQSEDLLAMKRITDSF